MPRRKPARAKSKPRRVRQQAATGDARLLFDGWINDKCVFVVRASKTKYGPRSSGKRWDAQRALIEIFNNRLLEGVSSWGGLTRRVDEILKRDNPTFYNKRINIDSNTVRRAFKDLRRS